MPYSDKRQLYGYSATVPHDGETWPQGGSTVWCGTKNAACWLRLSPSPTLTHACHNREFSCHWRLKVLTVGRLLQTLVGQCTAISPSHPSLPSFRLVSTATATCVQTPHSSLSSPPCQPSQYDPNCLFFASVAPSPCLLSLFRSLHVIWPIAFLPRSRQCLLRPAARIRETILQCQTGRGRAGSRCCQDHEQRSPCIYCLPAHRPGLSRALCEHDNRQARWYRKTVCRGKKPTAAAYSLLQPLSTSRMPF